MSDHLYHLAERDAWESAQAAGSYTMSTLGRSLSEEGFVHLAHEHQWEQVRRRFYGAHGEDLVLLEIDPDRLESAVVEEVGDPDTGERFPHLYGPLDLDAVVSERTLPAPHGD